MVCRHPDRISLIIKGDHNEIQERSLKRLITLGGLEIGIQHQIVNALELSTPPHQHHHPHPHLPPTPHTPTYPPPPPTTPHPHLPPTPTYHPPPTPTYPPQHTPTPHPPPPPTIPPPTTPHLPPPPPPPTTHPHLPPTPTPTYHPPHPHLPPPHPPKKKIENEKLFILVIGLVEKIGRTVKQCSDMKTSSIPLQNLEAQLSSLSLVAVMLILFVCHVHSGSHQYLWFSRISSTVANRYRKSTSLLKRSVSITSIS